MVSSDRPSVDVHIVPPAGVHGGDARRVARGLGVAVDDILDLSQSLNPFAPDLGSLVAPQLGEVGRYPDPEGRRVDWRLRSKSILPVC